MSFQVIARAYERWENKLEGISRRGFDQFIQVIMRNAFGDTKNRISLCVLARARNSNSSQGGIERRQGWECILGHESAGIELGASFQEEEDALLDRIRNNGQYTVICDAHRKNANDSRINGLRGPVSLLWIFLSNTDKESYRILSEVILDELEDKFHDIILMERIEELLRDKEREDILSHPWGKDLFAKLLDKQWIFLQYVNKALANHELPDWRLFVQVSAMFYEKRIISTKLFFTQEKDKEYNTNIMLCLKEKFVQGTPNDSEKNLEEWFWLTYKNLRTIRKVMEMSNSNKGLLIEKKETHQYVLRGIIYEKDPAPDICINIKDHMIWGMYNKKEELFEYRKGEFKFPEIERVWDYQEQLTKANEEYLHLKEEEIEKIINVVGNIKDVSSHGVSIIFMCDNLLSDEMKRLVNHNKAYRIQSIPLDNSSDDTIIGLTAIDGAIMSNMECQCVGVGAILDGKSCIEGNPGRGSRFNSVANYIEAMEEWRDKTKSGDRIAVIISEDGMVNVVYPNSERISSVV